MNYQIVGSGRAGALVVRPREASFGHQIVEIAMGLHLGRHLGRPVCFRRPTKTTNAALFEIECEEVSVLHGWRAWGVGLLARRAERRTLSRLEAQRTAATQAGRKFKPGPPDLHGMDFRDCYAHVPLTVRLRPSVMATARAAAVRLGLAPDARIVTVHARESGFKALEGGDGPADALRNARIETYLPACDLLVARGYTVVRIGDPAMTPFDHPGVIDLATSVHRTEALEVYCLLQAVLQIAGDSGPYCATYISRAPCLAVNVTNVVGGYPLRSHDRYLLKRVRDTGTGRALALREMVETDYFEHRKDLSRYAYTDNTPEEILDAVSEMLELLEDGRAPVPEQRVFRDLVDELYQSPAVSSRRVRKGEPAVQVLGDGFIGRAFVERCLDSSSVD